MNIFSQDRRELNSHSLQQITVLIMVCNCCRVSSSSLCLVFLVSFADHVFFLIVCDTFLLANTWAMCVLPSAVTISASDCSPCWRNVLLHTSVSFSQTKWQGDYVVIFSELISLVSQHTIEKSVFLLIFVKDFVRVCECWLAVVQVELNTFRYLLEVLAGNEVKI